MASRLGGGMGTQMMRILSNRKTGHPQKSMTAPPQVGGCEILNYFTLSEIKRKHVLSWVIHSKHVQCACTMTVLHFQNIVVRMPNDFHIL